MIFLINKLDIVLKKRGFIDYFEKVKKDFDSHKLVCKGKRGFIRLLLF